MQLRTACQVAIIVAAASLLAGCTKPTTSEPGKPTTPNPVATTEPAKPKDTPSAVTKIKAEDLAKEYTTDEEAADKKYHGKTLRVAGVVSKAGSDGVNSWVDLQGDGKRSLSFSFSRSNKDNEKAKALKEGAKVTIEGRVGDADKFNGPVHFLLCEIVE